MKQIQTNVTVTLERLYVSAKGHVGSATGMCIPDIGNAIIVAEDRESVKKIFDILAKSFGEHVAKTTAMHEVVVLNQKDIAIDSITKEHQRYQVVGQPNPPTIKEQIQVLQTQIDGLLDSFTDIQTGAVTEKHIQHEINCLQVTIKQLTHIKKVHVV